MYRFKTLGTQAGQGMIEYLLILILTVSIIFAIMNGVGRPVAGYMNSIFELVGCMLRVGEGPAVAYNLCGGLPSLEFDTSSLSSGSGGGATNSNSNNSSNNNSDDSNNSDSSGNNSGSSGSTRINPPSGRGSVDGNGGRRGGVANNFGDNDVGAGQSNRIKVPEDELGNDSSFSASGLGNQTVVIRRIRRRNTEQIGGSFSLVGQEEAVNSGAFGEVSPGPVKKKVPDGPENTRRRTSSFTVESDKKANLGATVKDRDDGFSLMKMIKWAIIIAIIIIFGAFTLSQLNSIRKGWTD